MVRKPPPSDQPIEHVPGQDAFPGLALAPDQDGPGNQVPALPHVPDDMTPQTIHPTYQDHQEQGPIDEHLERFYQPSQEAPPEAQAIQIMVPGRPSPANVLTAVLTLVTGAMLTDGWSTNAIVAAIHEQVDAAITPDTLRNLRSHGA